MTAEELRKQGNEDRESSDPEAGKGLSPTDGGGTGEVMNDSTVVSPGGDRFYYASQWELMWWRFKRHRLAVVSAALLLLLYITAITADFVMPYDPWERFPSSQQAPPTKVHFTAPGEGLTWPYIYRVEGMRDPETFRRRYPEQTDQRYPIGLFVRAEPYKLLGLIPTDVHLFGVADGANIWLFGLDMLGRDVFSRVLYGARVSLFIGLAGVTLTFIFGVLLGGMSGYFGGIMDFVIQRIIDILQAVPQLPLLMVLAAAVPPEWSALNTYFAMTLILSVVGWTGLARVVRGRLLSMREEDFALAAKAAGCNDSRIVLFHLLPGFMSHLIVNITMAIPRMILSETGLSFLGLGLYPPAVSWGVLLQDVRDLMKIAHMPWLLIPALCVLITVLLFNFVGDGLRDAADPYTM